MNMYYDKINNNLNNSPFPLYYDKINNKIYNNLNNLPFPLERIDAKEISFFLNGKVKNCVVSSGITC